MRSVGAKAPGQVPPRKSPGSHLILHFYLHMCILYQVNGSFMSQHAIENWLVRLISLPADASTD